MENENRIEVLDELRFRKPFVPTLEEQIADEIVRLRIRLNLTQAELAKEIGTTQSAISRAESGTRLPSNRFLNKIAEAFNLKLVIRFAPEVIPQEEWGGAPAGEPVSNIIRFPEPIWASPSSADLSWQQHERIAHSTGPSQPWAVEVA